jgi:hypothetical protein
VADAPLDERRELSEGATTGGRGFHKSRRIIDANPGLGGSFTVYWNLGPNPPAGARSMPAYTSNGAPHGYWDVTLESC